MDGNTLEYKYTDNINIQRFHIVITHSYILSISFFYLHYWCTNSFIQPVHVFTDSEQSYKKDKRIT